MATPLGIGEDVGATRSLSFGSLIPGFSDFLIIEILHYYRTRR